MKYRDYKFLLFEFSMLLFLILFNNCYAEGLTPNVISGENFGSLCEVFKSGDKEYILISKDSENTRISKLNTIDSSVKEVGKIKINCKYCYYQGNRIYILSDQADGNDFSLGNSTICPMVYVYDLQNKVIMSKAALKDEIISKERFCVDNDGRMYYIYKNNSIKTLSYSCDDEQTIDFEGPINSISFNESKGLIYAISNLYSKIFIYNIQDRSIKNFDAFDDCPNGRITFLENDKVLDSLNYVYEITQEGLKFNKKFQFIPRENFYNACKVKDKILSYNGTDKFYVFDNATYQLLGYIKINNNVACFSDEEKLLCICQNDGVYVYYIVDVDLYSNLEEKVFTENDNVFKFNPKSGIYDNVVLDENYHWELILQNDIIVDKYNSLNISVIDKNTGKSENLSLNNGTCVEGNCIKIFPGNMSYNNLFSYDLEIRGLCNSIGEPCVIKHKFEIYYKLPQMEECYISSDVYNIDYQNMRITGVQLQTSITAFKNNFDVKGYSMKILDRYGSIKTSGKVGTGTIVNFLKDDKLYYQFKVIIYGDITGNGNITSKDLYVLRNYLLGNSKILGDFLIAADINHDNKVDTLDLLCLSEYLLGEYEIVQE